MLFFESSNIKKINNFVSKLKDSGRLALNKKLKYIDTVSYYSVDIDNYGKY